MVPKSLGSVVAVLVLQSLLGSLSRSQVGADFFYELAFDGSLQKTKAPAHAECMNVALELIPKTHPQLLEAGDLSFAPQMALTLAMMLLGAKRRFTVWLFTSKYGSVCEFGEERKALLLPCSTPSSAETPDSSPG